MFLFSGGCPSAYIKQSLSIHSISGTGRKPVKKIPASATVLLTMKVEVQSPYNRISISHNRRGHRAFAVFLPSLFFHCTISAYMDDPHIGHFKIPDNRCFAYLPTLRFPVVVVSCLFLLAASNNSSLIIGSCTTSSLKI